MGINSSSLLLGVDIGTSSTKTCLFTDEGKLVAEDTQEYKTNYPKPAWAEENPDDWLNASIVTIKNVLKSSKIKAGDIAGISISGLTPNCVPIDQKGLPIRSAIIWIDRRSDSECEWIKKEIGLDKCTSISGNQIDPYFGGPKFLWFRKNEPDLFKKTKKILTGSNYVLYHMTDERAVTDHSVAGLCSPCYDYKKQQWSEEICEAMELPIEILPELRYSHEIIGEINEKMAKKTGLKKGTPVVTGGGDFACSTLGAGVIDEGEACAMYGTAGNILIPLNKTSFDIRLLNTSHVVKDKYLTLGSIFSGGIVRWFRNTFGSTYQILDEEASKISVGSDELILLPYFMGERTPIWDVHARGVYLGLTPYHKKAHLYRAILEGTGYALNHIVEIVKSKDISIKEIIAVDGGAKSKLWRQIVSDIMGIPQSYMSKTGGAPIGDAILAGIGCGLFQDARIVKKWIPEGDKTNPIPKNHDVYKKYYKLFLKVYENLKSSFVDLHEIGKK